jgi:beta-lactamase class D
MKKITFLLAFIFVSMTASQSVYALSSNDSLQNNLNRLLDQWHRDAAEGNHAAYIGAMTGDGVFIGTDATEYWTTPEFSAWCKPHFDRKRTWDFHSFNRNLYLGSEGNTAWFDELLTTQMGVCRGSGVLVKKDGTWKIAQYVLSATIPNEKMKQVTALKCATDSALVMKSIFDKYGLTGTILVYDPASDRFLGYNSARWDSGYLPASTFKVPNTLIALETGVIDTGFIFKWDGKKRRLPQWEKDLSLRDAFRVSCVPCYQELARRIGPERMRTYLKKMQYPGMDVRPENIDLFWLEGNSRITPRQQVDFMKRLYYNDLLLKPSVMQMMKAIMVNEVTPEYSLSGKTGWSVRNGNNYGWFVGWIEVTGKVYFLATLVEPKNQEKVEDFIVARKTVTVEVLRWMGIINGEQVK